MQVWSNDDNSFVDDNDDDTRKLIKKAKKYIELRESYLQNPDPNKPLTISIIMDALGVDAKTTQEIIDFAENDLGEYEAGEIRDAAQQHIDMNGNIVSKYDL